MSEKHVLVDDYDGKELPEDTQPLMLSLGRTTYRIYLSEQNYGKLLEALNPFIENAEQEIPSPVTIGNFKRATAPVDTERDQAVRAWAQSTGFTFKNASGDEVALGDRGPIPQEVFDAYDKAN